MLFKNFLLLSKRTQRHILQTNFLRTLTNSSGSSSTIRDGVLFSDSADIYIPSTNVIETIYEKIEPFQKFRAIVSLQNFS